MSAAVVVLALTLALGPLALALETVTRTRRLRERARLRAELNDGMDRWAEANRRILEAAPRPAGERLNTERGRWVRVVRVDASESPAEFLEVGTP